MIYEHYIVWAICIIGVIGIIMLGSSVFLSSGNDVSVENQQTNVVELSPTPLEHGEIPTKQQMYVEEL